MTPLLRSLAAALPLFSLAACEVLPTQAKVDFPTATAPAIPESGPPPIPAMAPMTNSYAAAPQAPVTGSIYQSASYRPMFEDHRARLVGDTLTIQIVEKIAASQSANSTVDKTGELGVGISALPGVKLSHLAGANASATSGNTFAGKGATTSTNDFTGTITASVVGVLPNGHLIVAGEKQIGVNQHVDVLRFTGQVDPRSIQPGNTIPSAQVANVRVEHRGRGAMADAQGTGWLARFFLSLWPV
ncbi:MAG TPA: flagellar basal body L-ring protein FlgH [Ideonella sp.]|uniref:flagellar basal body L-ring protein FlgH n=1 Tax=Ideonella sp. TaxID=1929293 RepID=UPI002E36EA6F|nr:flagellar basal body L-ring protein FlgH [Ideonella sp.]HEX5685343.1 flagellar basal body L-ring protein FlgH [Ideonella sp.]